MMSEYPHARLKPLAPDTQFADILPAFRCAGSVVPNTILILQRKPQLVRAYVALFNAIYDPETGETDAGLKNLIAHAVSRAASCAYCMTHTIGLAHCSGVDDARIEALAEFRVSPLYTDAERAAIAVAFASGEVPNTVTDAMFAKLRQYWSDSQVVEIIAVIALFGFLNRLNDTLATPIETEALTLGEKYLSSHGWQPGRHLRTTEDVAAKP